MDNLSQKKLKKLQGLVYNLLHPEQHEWQYEKGVQILDEKYLHNGDYVLVFNNPDHESFEFRDKVITIADIMVDYEKCFEVECSFEKINEQSELLRMAFLGCVTELNKAHSIHQSIVSRTSEFFSSSKAPKLFYFNQEGNKIRVVPHETRAMGQGFFLGYDPSQNKWIRTSNQVRDLYTLTRVYTLFKLATFGGFYIRQFLSLNGEKIIAVLYQSLDNLKIEAQRIGLKMKVDVALCDILSLEPVDESFRPLRLNNYITSEDHPLANEELRNHIVAQLEQINYTKLAKQCGQPPYKPTGEILFQKQIPHSQWKVYLFYLKQLHIEIHRIREKYAALKNHGKLRREDMKRIEAQNYKHISYRDKSKKSSVQTNMKDHKHQLHAMKVREYLRHKRAVEFKTAIVKIHEHCKKLYGNILLNIWDICESEPVGPYVEFFLPNKKKAFKQIMKTENMWTNQIINESGQISIFNKMERAKLSHSIINQIINLEYLKEVGYVNQFYIMNDFFDLQGTKIKKQYHDLFKKQREVHNLLFSQMTKRTKRKIMSQESMAQSKSEPKHSGGLKGGQNLVDNWGMLNVPIQYLAEYYGERVALYFLFIYYFIEELVPISFFGVVTFIVQFLYEQNQLPNKMAIIFFTLLIVFWTSTFQSMWKQKEIMFQTMFGIEDVETEQVQLVGFTGKASRSIASDKMNELKFSSAATWFRIIIGLTIVVFFIVIEIILICIQQYMTVYFENNQLLPPIVYFDSEVLIPSLVWVLVGFGLESIFRIFAFKLTQWENHKYLQSFETSFIIKNLMFSTVNRLGSPFIIAFINPITFGCIKNNNCYYQLQVYMRIAFILDFGKHLLFGFLFPLIKHILQRISIEVTTIADSDTKLYKESPFLKMNKNIEIENKKKSFAIQQVDGTIWQYLESSLQFALLANYGSPFPIVYILCFGINVFQLLIDKYQLIWLTQRPIPQNARSIGTFVYYLDLISYISIFTNSAILSFTDTSVFQNIESFTLFVILMISLFTFKFITDIIYGNVDSKVDQIKKRHQQIKRKINVGQRTKSNLNSEPSLPLLKIYGTLLEVPKKD